jgi:hypothetical protein
MEHTDKEYLFDAVDKILATELRFKIGQIAMFRTRDNLSTADLKLLEQYTRDVQRMRSELTGSSEALPQKEFDDLMQITTYLQEQGYKVKKSTVYLHSKQDSTDSRAEPGKPRPKKLPRLPSGKFSQIDVDKYAKRYLDRLSIPNAEQSDPDDDSQPESSFLDVVQAENIRTTARLKSAQADHWEKRNRDLDEEIRRGIGHNMAERGRFFRLNLINFFHANAATMISIVDGDQTKLPDFLEHCLAAVESFLAPYSQEAELTLHAAPDQISDPPPAVPSSPEDEKRILAAADQDEAGE